MTEQERTTSTAPSPIVVEEIYPVAPAVVWQALTDPTQMSQWFFEPIESFRPEVGFETRFTVRAFEKDFVHLWKVTEVVPLHRLAYTFDYEGYHGDAGVTWELEEVADGTRLTLTHRGVESYPRDEPAFEREAGVAGWTYFLRESLKGFLEPG